MDRLVHGRYREALNPNFNRDQIARAEPRAHEIAVILIGQMLAGDEVEFIDSFATPFALKTLCAALGWSEKQ